MLTEDQLGFLQLADTAVLAAVARGEIDLNRLARETLAGRGMDADGKWVGFEEAARRLSESSPTLAEIARDHLGFPTLETQNSDSLDFRDVAVWKVEEALNAAFAAGKAER